MKGQLTLEQFERIAPQVMREKSCCKTVDGRVLGGGCGPTYTHPECQDCIKEKMKNVRLA